MSVPRRVEPDAPVPDDVGSHSDPRFVFPEHPVSDDQGAERKHLAPFSETHFPFRPQSTLAKRVLRRNQPGYKQSR